MAHDITFTVGRPFAAAARALRGAAVSVAGLTAALALTPAAAQVGARVVEEPPAAVTRSAEPVERLTGAAPTLAVAPPQLPQRGPGHEVFYDLTVDYVTGKLYNPATGLEDQARLRAYVGDVTDPLIPFVGPRVDIWPGETFRLTLHNRLPADDPSCAAAIADPNIPHCFNSTNMHTHGLWVSPTGNSDNVLLTVNPGVDFQYEYNIPTDHAAGTFWYHSHLHGSTALQVSSGMAGALIIHGDRLPAREPDGAIKTGDIDTLLRTPDGAPFRDRVILFQQIAYACRDAEGKIKTNPDGTWRCNPGDVGEIDDYDQFGPGSWNASGRYTSINGVVVPTFTGSVTGAVERWRLIHGGVRDTINLQFRKLEPGMATAAYRAASADEREAFVVQNCTGTPIDELSMASDGLTRGRISQRTNTVMQPGYREDLLMVFPEPGVYCMIDDRLDAGQTVNSQPHGAELLGYIEVAEGPPAPGGSATDIVRETLVASARANMPASVSDAIVADLQNGLRLSAFIDQPDVAAGEVTGRQGLGFRILNATTGGQPKIQFEIGELGRDLATNRLVLINSKPYDPQRVDRTLRLGGVDEWTLTSFFVGHPFHIHVNPFQIVSILDPSGNDVSGPGDGSGNQYANLKGVWKDTIFVEQGYVITMRTRYRRYIGEFVLHCHILDHEDQGMMQNVRIAIPDGHGGLTASHH